MQPDLILVPFAQDAPAVNVDAIPVNLSPSDPPQAASWSQGFPTVTMTPLAAGGIPPRGQSFNGVLQDITEHLVYIGGGGQYRWSSAYVTAKGGYSIGDVIQADSGLLSYVSLVDNNDDNFNTNPSSIGPKWRAWAGAPIPDATTSQRGAVLLATQSQANAGSGDAVLTPETRAVAAQNQASVFFATTGTATAQILTPFPAIPGYAIGQRFNVTFNVGSGLNPTINVSGRGARALKQYDALGAKVPAVFVAGQNGDIVNDGTDFVLIDQLPPSSGLPIGSVVAICGSSLPEGMLKANGAVISRTTYSNLFAAIGTVFGAGDGSTTFKLPDLRGEFIRGWDDGRGIDVSRVFGSLQLDELKSHTHTVTTGAPSSAVNPTSGTNFIGGGSNTGATGGVETRPRNVALTFVIKY